MPRGGKRPGAGRPKGSSSKKALAIVKAAEEYEKRTPPPPPDAELSPLDIMMDNIRWLKGPALEQMRTILDPATPEDERKLRLTLFMEQKSLRKELQAAARDAAPYIHRRLAGDKPIEGDEKAQPTALIVAEEVNA